MLVTEVLRTSQPSSLWFHRFLATARRTVVFQDDVGFERADATRRGAAVDHWLVVLDLERGAEVARASLPARVPRVLDARFVAAPPAAR